jgi:hypothetical protein
MGRPRSSTPPATSPVIAVTTLALLHAILTSRRGWGMRVTVSDDATTTNNCEWVLVKGMDDDDLSNNDNWAPTKIEIGAWDMDANFFVSVTHNLPDHTKVKTIDAMILNDFSASLHPLHQVDSVTFLPSGGVFVINALEIELVRTTGGNFDTVDYAGVGNRGWIYLDYH